MPILCGIMGILSDVFVATDAQVAAASFADGGPTALFPTLHAKGVDPVALANLLARINDHRAGALDSKAFAIAEELNVIRDLGAEAGGPEYENVIVRLPIELISRLSVLTPTDMAHYGAAWADTFWRRTPRPTPEFIEGITTYLGRLCRLARQARDKQKSLFLWICV